MWHKILHWKTLILRHFAHMGPDELILMAALLVLVSVYCLKGSNRRLGI